MAIDSFNQQPDAREPGIQSFAFVIAASVCVLLSSYFVVSGLLWLRPAYEVELQRQINPNNAPLGSLVRLPGIGTVRAEAIIAYRKNFTKHQGQRRAFQSCDDLQKVSGIGPKTVQNISEWLKFE